MYLYCHTFYVFIYLDWDKICRFACFFRTSLTCSLFDAIANLPNAVRPTAHTLEYLAQFLRDTHHPGPGTQNFVTHEHADNAHPLRDSTTQYNQSSPPTISVLPAASSSSPASVIPPARGGPPPTTESSLSSTRTSIQNLPSQTGPLAAEGTCSSVTLASTMPPVDSRASFSSMSSLSSTGDTSMSFSGASLSKMPLSCVVQLPKVLGEGAEMTFSEDGGEMSATGGTNTL